MWHLYFFYVKQDKPHLGRYNIITNKVVVQQCNKCCSNGSLALYPNCQTAGVEGWGGYWPTGWLTLTSWPPVWWEAQGSSLSQDWGQGEVSPQTARPEDEACRPFSAYQGNIYFHMHIQIQHWDQSRCWLTTRLWETVHVIAVFSQLANEWWDNERTKRLINITIVWNFSFIHSFSAFPPPQKRPRLRHGFLKPSPKSRPDRRRGGGALDGKTIPHRLRYKRAAPVQTKAQT